MEGLLRTLEAVKFYSLYETEKKEKIYLIMMIFSKRFVLIVEESSVQKIILKRISCMF